MALAFALIAAASWLVFIGVRGIWRTLISVNPDLAVAVIVSAATLLASTITVMLGRYFERKREIEAHFRAEKIKIYDEFLAELFKVFHSANEVSTDQGGEETNEKMVQFLREWQRKLVLWGGNCVLATYFAWMNRMKSLPPDAQTIFLMDEFFRALRADIGQSSNGLPRGAFANLVLRHGDFFLAEAKKNPHITLEELSALEKTHFGENQD